MNPRFKDIGVDMNRVDEIETRVKEGILRLDAHYQTLAEKYTGKPLGSVAGDLSNEDRYPVMRMLIGESFDAKKVYAQRHLKDFDGKKRIFEFTIKTE